MTDLRPRAIPDGPVVFDCDGTLVSTEGSWDKAYAALFTCHQRELARTDRQRLVGLTRIDLGGWPDVQPGQLEFLVHLQAHRHVLRA